MAGQPHLADLDRVLPANLITVRSHPPTSETHRHDSLKRLDQYRNLT